MRTAVDLLELPYTFRHASLLMPAQFQSMCRERDVFVTDSDLEALHRQRLVVPLLRISRDWATIKRLLRHEPRAAFEYSHWQPTSRQDLIAARQTGHLFDPTTERFRSAQECSREMNRFRYEQSVYVYSEHQLIQLPLVHRALGHRWLSPGKVEIHADRRWLDQWRAANRQAHEVVIAASALEQLYYPVLFGRYGVSVNELDEYEAWRRQLPPTRMLRWLDIVPTWLTENAAGLLRLAESIDPTGDWSEVIAHGTPDSWKRLKGVARNAFDIRAVAELLLLYYDRLVKGRRGRALVPPSRRAPGPFAARLKPQRSLDAVLTEFGISPHPSLVLVLEGHTEMLLMPLVMEVFSIPRDDSDISLQNAEGVGRDLSALAAFIAPRVALDPDRRALDLERPASRILVAFDPEGPAKSVSDRKALRDKLLDRIARALPPEHRDRVEREYIEPMVHVETWNRRGDSFEFAHFTDPQIARAILSVGGRHQRRTLADTKATVGELRRKHGNLATAVSGKKLELAAALWPVLERRIAQARGRGTVTRIPVVRVLGRALELADELPRRNLVIPLTEQESNGPRAGSAPKA